MQRRLIAAALALLCDAVPGPVAAAPVVCRSPDGTLAIELSLRKDGTAEGVPHYRIRAGAADVIGWSRTVAPAMFKPRDKAPVVMGTPCRTLASYVVYQNHLPMVAASPSAYAGHPALPVLVQIPTTWDDTQVVAESVEGFVAVARRQGEVWHLGAMTDRKARRLKVPLRFLGPGRYAAELCLDDAEAKHGLAQREVAVTATEELTVDLAASGGAYLKFRLTE